jgi:hypothetical protein
MASTDTLVLVPEREADSEESDPTADQMYPNLRESLRVLASPADEQEAWAHSGGNIVPPPAEMRLSYLDHVPDLLYLYSDGKLIDDGDEAALLKLESFLMRPAKDVTPYMRWSAVAESEEWGHIRELAQAALVSLNRPASKKRPNQVESD